MALTEFLASATLALSTCIFASLVAGNYLVFAPSQSLQTLGTHLLAPSYFLSVSVLDIYPFNEGVWAFASFCAVLLSFSVLRSSRVGLAHALLESCTLVGPSVLIIFEVGVFFLIPSYFYAQVTNFVSQLGLGSYLTNFSVLVISLVTLSATLVVRLLRRTGVGV